jgi:hypothetical protein
MSAFTAHDAWHYKQSLEQRLSSAFEHLREEWKLNALTIAKQHGVKRVEQLTEDVLDKAYYAKNSRIDRPYTEQMTFLSDMLKVLHRTRIVIWRPEIWQLSQRNYQAFQGEKVHISEEVSYNPQLWLFPDGIDYFYNTEEAKAVLEMPLSFRLFGLWIAGAKFGVGIEQAIGNSTMQVLIYEPPNCGREWDHRLITDVFQPEDEVVKPEYASIVAARHFLELEFVTNERHRLARPLRNQLARQHLPEPDIRTIVLRRGTRNDRPANGDHREVDWQCQWLVNGHWRKYFAKDGVWRRTWVNEHIKGPEDKPLKISEGTVYVARR